jgi:hypothetical protein
LGRRRPVHTIYQVAEGGRVSGGQQRLDEKDEDQHRQRNEPARSQHAEQADAEC